MDDIDIAIIGAGPAGLSAALYAARFCRRTTIFHNDRARAARIPLTRNVPGFENGISGPDLLGRMEGHATKYGAEMIVAHIASASKTKDSFLLASDDGRSWRARSVILATGLEMNQIPLDEATHEQAIKQGVLRYCPICDGFEHRGERIGVVGLSESGAAEALFLKTFSDDITLLARRNVSLSEEEQSQLKAAGIAIIAQPITAYIPTNDAMTIRVEGRDLPLTFDVVYPALGCHPLNDLARQLGLQLNDSGNVAAGAPSETGVPGLFCAGDLVEGLDQIAVAMGHGALAATAAHNWLRECDGATVAGVLEADDPAD